MVHTGFIGTSEHRKGCGKTLYAVYKAKKAFDKGKKVYSNTPLTFDYTPLYPEMLLLQDFNNAFLLIDEIPSWFNSLSTSFATILLSILINQTRKKHNDICWTAQRFNDVHIRIREDATVYVCYKLHTNWQRCIDSEDECTYKHVIMIYERLEDDILTPRNILKVVKSVIDLYDTTKTIPLHLFDTKRLKKLYMDKEKEITTCLK